MKRIFNHFGTRVAVFALSGAVIVAGSALASSQKSKNDSKADTKNASLNVTVDERPLSRELGGHASFSPVVKKVTPAVVKVFTTTKMQTTGFTGPQSQGMEELMRRFFGQESNGRQSRRGPAPEQQGVGSGVIVTKDGYILTNNHVVDGADEVKVAMQDGHEFTAKVIGRDPRSDVAVIKIDANDLPAVPMADSEKVEIGDVVLAIGNPFGIGQTVTTGIVSATGRATMGLDYEDFIQTDAAINPGNSGGALVDTEGRLIGINTAILSRTGGNQGIGFAIPANMARDVMASLVKDGYVSRGYLGVSIQDVTPKLATQFKLRDNSGALVGDVAPQSPAEKAGFRSGDLVTEFNGKRVSDSQHLRLAVARTQPGESVPVKVLRDGSAKTLEVTVRAQPGSEDIARHDRAPKEDDGTLNGVTVDDLDSSNRQQYDVPTNVKGVVVKQVEPDSAAAHAGLKEGDVIMEINRKPVTAAEEAVKLTEKTTDKTSLLRVWGSGRSRWVVVDENKQG